MGSKVDVPATTDPNSTDWQNFIAWVEKAQTGKINITFSNMDTTLEPKIQAGSIVEIAGSLYSFSAEEAATGWSGIANSTQAYMRLIASGDTVSAEWTTTAPTYRDDLQGWYEAGTNKRYVLRVYKEGDSYTFKTYLQRYKDVIVELDGQISVLDLSKISIWPSIIVYNSFSSPNGQTLDVTYDTSTGNLISVDGDTNKIYIHDGVSSTTTSNFSTPNIRTKGITYDTSTGNLISSSWDSGLIYIHDGVSSTILNSFSTPAGNSGGLTYDNSTENLISCDRTSGLIYIHDGVSSTVLDSFSVGAPQGVAYDNLNGNLISCDTNKIYIHDGVSSTVLDSFAGPYASTYGLTFDRIKNNLISCDSATDTISIHKSRLLL